MAYKNEYDNLLQKIQGSGQNWSEYDLGLARENPDAGASIYTQKERYAKAQSDEEREAANRAAEEIRQKYGGYTGGGDGTGFSFSDKYAAPAQGYNSRYGNQIDALMRDIMGRKDFSYNPGADPSYQAYAEKYRNLGNQARENALGSAAAMTGGQLNSYALTAAQQAQNAYNAQLSDAIPQLQQLAYDMYLGDLGQKRSDLSALQGLDEMQYGRYLDQLTQRNTERNFNYGVTQDDQNAALQKAQLLAAAGDYSGYKALGYTDEEIGKLQSAYMPQTGGRQVAGQPEKNEDTYDENAVSKVASGLLTDLRKYYASSEDAYNRIEQEYKNGGISYNDYLWLLDRVGLL